MRLRMCGVVIFIAMLTVSGHSDAQIDQKNWSFDNPIMIDGAGARDKQQTFRNLSQRALQLYQDGKFAEAIPLAEQALKLAEQVLGEGNPDTLTIMGNLGSMHRALGHSKQAEPLFERAYALSRRSLGEEHPGTILATTNLADLYTDQGRYNQAEPLLNTALVTSERVLGENNEDTLRAVNNLAFLYSRQGNYSKVELLYKRALQGHVRLFSTKHAATLTSMCNLAAHYLELGRYQEAEQLYKQALSVGEEAFGKDHPSTLQSAYGLGSVYLQMGQYGDAEALLRRVLQFEQLLGQTHPTTISALNSLTTVYFEQRRYGEAEPLFNRVIADAERAFGRDHPTTLNYLANLAALYQIQRRYNEAEPIYRQIVTTLQRTLGPGHPQTVNATSNLAALYTSEGRYSEAERLHKWLLKINQQTLGQDHPKTISSLGNLGGLYFDQGLYEQAKPFFEQAVLSTERVLGKAHPHTIDALNNLAALHFQQGEWRQAAAIWQRSTSAMAERSVRSTQDADRMLSGQHDSETTRVGRQFHMLLKATYRALKDGNQAWGTASRDGFEAAQWALGSEAARSLAQMAARGAKGDPALAILVRERQDLAAEWQRRDALRVAGLGRPADQRNGEAEAKNRQRFAEIDGRIAEIDRTLSAKFPDYAALANPAPVSVAEAQALLHKDEALVLFVDTPKAYSKPEETFLWVVTKADMRWVRSELGSEALVHEVQSLRCGLDAVAWTNGGDCKKLGGSSAPGHSLPFDLARAHRLYKTLLGGAEDLIKGKDLLIVPSGPLTQLPFQVLITEPPANEDYRSAAWLIRDHAITVLPAVSSLKALRRVSRPSAAAKSLIGFGNPLLEGPDKSYAKYAKLAREKQSCPKSGWQLVAAYFGLSGGVMPIDIRGGLANISHIRMQAPLPETADELCAVAADIKAEASEMRLGARATEREVKALSASGALANYRIVHFATHGAMAGELSADSEPGLVLTPPDEASPDDDGYLSASEIAGLKLDADWVILSACNTASGQAANAEALSGLARAFIYAQARALLVSHWAVDSNATVKLITSAMREIARDRNVGRAEAVRRAMLAMINGGDTSEAHPSAWAPFIVVGEGAR